MRVGRPARRSAGSLRCRRQRACAHPSARPRARARRRGRLLSHRRQLRRRPRSRPDCRGSDGTRRAPASDRRRRRHGWSSPAVSGRSWRTVQREAGADPKPAVPRRSGLHRSTQYSGPLAHPDEATAVTVRGVARRSAAVVDHVDVDGVRAVANRHGGPCGVAVTQRVRQRLLHDAIRRDVDTDRKRRRLALLGHRDVETCTASDGGELVDARQPGCGAEECRRSVARR